MIRSIAVSAAVLITTAVEPAAAQAPSVSVQVAGKPEAAIRADIRQAAQKVCATRDDFQVGVPQATDVAQCARITERKTIERLDQAVAARSASSQMAGLSGPAKGAGR